jgi:hypothetical protein
LKIKIHLEAFGHCLSPPNTYSFVQEENLGSTRKKITYCLHVLPTKFMHYTYGAWAGGTFLRQWKKSSSSPCTVSVFLRLSVHLSVCLFIHSLSKHVEFSQELKSGCPRGVFCPLSTPSKYLFLCTRRKFGFNKKIHTKLLIDYVYFQPNYCNTHAEREWAQGTFLRQRRKVPPAHAQRV